MTDNELLLAIADIMDRKMDARFRPVENGMQTIQSEICIMKEDIRTMQGEMQGMKGDIRAIQGEMQDMKEDIRTIQSEMQDMKEDIRAIQDEMQVMHNEIHNTKLFQENILLPRLNTIESCYTDTYERYKKGADRMEATFVDTELLKRVVSEHSEKLKKIS